MQVLVQIIRSLAYIKRTKKPKWNYNIKDITGISSIPFILIIGLT